LHLFPTTEPNEQDSIVENLLAILERVLRQSDKETKTTMEIEQEIGSDTTSDLKNQNQVKNVEMCLARITQNDSANTLSIFL